MQKESKQLINEFLDDLGSYSTEKLKENIGIIDSEIEKHKDKKDLASIFIMIRNVVHDELNKRNGGDSIGVQRKAV